MRLLMAILLMTGLARAEGEAPGDFDYYVLSLSWSPNWCALEGDARGSPQCARGAGFGWVLHGLWPQYDRGWPSYCRTARRDPTRAQTAAMADIMGAPGWPGTSGKSTAAVPACRRTPISKPPARPTNPWCARRCSGG